MSPIVVWIWLCAYLNCAGWALSAIHQLNAGGYAVALGFGLAGGLACWKRSGTPLVAPAWPKLRRRFRRGFPRAFLALAAMALLGGLLYAPANYDALAYRTPRVLHWLADGHWHWLHTVFQRVNTRTTGFEWLTAPIFVFAGSDRPEFLLNFISFLLLPGRFFALLTLLGVRGRTAWHWMWLFPAGYGYVLQAGSAACDMFGALMGFAAIEFVLRATRERRVAYVWTALPAVALMTAAKAFNILMLLPWALAALPALKLLLRRPVISFAVIVFAASASLLPTAVMNWRQCRDWTGLAVEQPMIGGNGKPYRFLANAISLPMHNLAPPIFPMANQWNRWAGGLAPQTLAAKLQANMEPSLATFQLPEMQVEEGAGLGLGVTLLLLAILARKIRAREFTPGGWFTVQKWVPLATWAALGVFMMQVGAAGPARYLLPFYPLLATPILTGSTAARFFRSRFWRGAAWVVFGSAALLLVLSPARPLWPATAALQALIAKHPNVPMLQRIDDVYSAYGMRADGFAPVIAALPPDANPLGYLAFDEPEAALWRPFGARRIVHFTETDSAADLRAQGLKYALVSIHTLEQRQTNPADWLARMHAEVVGQFDLKLLAGQEPRHWLLVRLP